MWKLFATQYVNDWDEVCYQPTALGYATLLIVGLICIGLALWIVRSSGKGGKRRLYGRGGGVLPHSAGGHNC